MIDTAAEAVTETTETTLTAPLQVHDRCQVQWREEEGEYLDAIVIHRRPLHHRKRKAANKKNEADVNVDSLPADEVEYYVHYMNHDRRLDEWVTLDKFQLNTLQRHAEDAADENDPTSSSTTGAVGRPSRRRSSMSNYHPANQQSYGENDEADATTEPKDLLSGGNWHGEDPTLEREHEEATKVKNIETIVIGKWQVETWYYSPFPAAYCDLETLYVCEYCLSYMKNFKTYKHHVCAHRHPPGKEIYRHEDVSVYEIDGKEHRVYCQKLCLLAKLFLDHKTLYFETTPFLFYIVTKVDAEGAHIVGYFSKEKNSSEGYNLACILTFPQYQKCGFGKFIISLSYELTKLENKTGSPEKPLSDLGKLSYRSYWTHVLMLYFANHDVTVDTNITQISAETGIRSEDIISTLQYLDMIKVWKGQHVIYVKQSIIRNYMKKE
ncbi:histone acetyltransferase MYST1 [Fistulifera solaris]|uniref:Histone acetyltransferase n=1 Tax=Fistulifera solaris TaxID=1519565 RepID=A0A1Z5K5V1_FISSO|nr:histone acetyltransferase MYST1 [Fistulifera solaris]|eukprot:GAX21532.1 histone acetyltransferase MYST1 [Fistulifera solaris]